jgi:hypothetical protein
MVTPFVSDDELGTIGAEHLPNGLTYIRYKIGLRVLFAKPVWYAKEVESWKLG